MEIRPIKTIADYKAALKEIEGFMGAKKDSPEGDRLDVLATLVDAYEERRFPIEAPDPVEAIRFRMEQMGLILLARISNPSSAAGRACRKS